ncbi:uncharacterized protein LOC126380052 [Pectinophora gossypiella]|uniref:uncharacterized protein LOC126380052 n=1 Tax=Pectinophora gossypiella TaxID=13191 RepID=UPI00214F1064|nr:uncharacterized protein LOC126380052 [Pectinophora gossypiella]
MTKVYVIERAAPLAGCRRSPSSSRTSCLLPAPIYLPDGFYVLTKGRLDDEWPNQWNFIGENYSLNTPHPAHYNVKFLKVAFILSYVIVFAALSVVVWHLVRGCPGAVARRQQRERVLRRHHQHRLTHLRRHLHPY